MLELITSQKHHLRRENLPELFKNLLDSTFITIEGQTAQVYGATFLVDVFLRAHGESLGCSRVASSGCAARRQSDLELVPVVVVLNGPVLRGSSETACGRCLFG